MDEDRIRMGGAYARIKAGIGSMASVNEDPMVYFYFNEKERPLPQVKYVSSI